jgi:hypothetical protein
MSMKQQLWPQKVFSTGLSIHFKNKPSQVDQVVLAAGQK